MFITSICLLFLIKLRWPQKKPITQILKQRYGNDIVNVFRSYEKDLLKYNKAGKDI